MIKHYLGVTIDPEVDKKIDDLITKYNSVGANRSSIANSLLKIGLRHLNELFPNIKKPEIAVTK